MEQGWPSKQSFLQRGRAARRGKSFGQCWNCWFRPKFRPQEFWVLSIWPSRSHATCETCQIWPWRVFLLMFDPNDRAVVMASCSSHSTSPVICDVRRNKLVYFTHPWMGIPTMNPTIPRSSYMPAQLREKSWEIWENLIIKWDLSRDVKDLPSLSGFTSWVTSRLVQELSQPSLAVAWLGKWWFNPHVCWLSHHNFSENSWENNVVLCFCLCTTNLLSICSFTYWFIYVSIFYFIHLVVIPQKIKQQHIPIQVVKIHFSNFCWRPWSRT